MKNLDDCHNYELSEFQNPNIKQKIHFFEMRKDGVKIDGVTNEEVLNVLIHRLNALNSGELRCRENSIAITKLEECLFWLQRRTEDRKLRNIEGTKTP